MLNIEFNTMLTMLKEFAYTIDNPDLYITFNNKYKPCVLSR